MHNHPKVCIIIPFYNGDEFIEACVNSVLASTYSDIQICIVNNSTKDTDVHKITAWLDRLIVLDETPKIGFSRANNAGAKYALSINAEILIILNQDTLLLPNTIEELIQPLLMDSENAITAPIPYTYDFHEIEAHFIQWYLTQCPTLFSDSLDGNVKPSYVMDEISGACFAIKADIVRMYGLFDPLYFMYMEDMDLCRKIMYLNRKIVLAPAAKIAHAHSNTDEDKGKKDQISLHTRRSRAIYTLKEVNKSMPFNIAKYLRISLEDYLNSLTKLHFKKLVSQVYIDIKSIGMISSIIKTRKKEIEYKKHNKAKRQSV